MGTIIRSELSKKNRYWISRHRYYELKHFCLQYNEWKQSYLSISALPAVPTYSIRNGETSNPVAKVAEARMFYKERMDMIERLAKEADSTLCSYIFIGVTEGLTYDVIRARMDCPCCRDVYYETYRRFFWLLSKERG